MCSLNSSTRYLFTVPNADHDKICKLDTLLRTVSHYAIYVKRINKSTNTPYATGLLLLKSPTSAPLLMKSFDFTPVHVQALRPTQRSSTYILKFKKMNVYHEPLNNKPVNDESPLTHWLKNRPSIKSVLAHLLRQIMSA
jgi:hypothetical protein